MRRFAILEAAIQPVQQLTTGLANLGIQLNIEERTGNLHSLGIPYFGQEIDLHGFGGFVFDRIA